MAEAYEVVTAALAAHRTRLAGLAGELEEAADVASGMRMTGDAYGETCQRFAAMLETLAATGRATLRTGVAALESAAGNIDASATTYDERETDAITGLTAAGEGP